MKEKDCLRQQWRPPLPLKLSPSADGESFKTMQEGCTALPLPPHPGAFGAVRKHHIHEGVDLYCPPGTPVFAVEDGVVAARLAFTGPAAGSPWWHDTEAVMIEGASGVVNYGEIAAAPSLRPGSRVSAGERIGAVVPVLRTDKGRPQTMLHLELYAPGTKDAAEWKPGTAKPGNLRDPTKFLMTTPAP